MTTDFSILSGSTVPESYSWDVGVPFDTSVTEEQAYSTASYISGYAPGLKVVFDNNSASDDTPTNSTAYIDYSWNFGDNYNDGSNNVSLSCPAPVQHIYLMPGRYTVTLTHTQAFTQTVVDPSPNLCRDKYDINWYWDNLQCSQLDAKTWDQTLCNATYAKWWDLELACFQKYCRQWSWEQLKCGNSSQTKWEETQTGGVTEKRWQYEANDTVCSTPSDYQTTTDSQQQVTTKQFIVEVKEIMPVAGMYSVTRPITGISPHTVQLTPRTTKCGSFPIDRIDWDFGDGSPIKTVVRYGGNTTDTELVNNEIYSADVLDPRNFDVIHTYNRSADTYPVYYPSLTAYSANTGSSDSCSITIGPIDLPDANSQIDIIKIKNTLEGALYTISYDNKCTFVTNVTGVKNIAQPAYTVPQNNLRDSYGQIVIYFGNNGGTYPPYTPPTCAGYETIIPVYALVMEENTDIDTSTLNLSALSAIMQESDRYILV